MRAGLGETLSEEFDIDALAARFQSAFV